MAGFVMAGFFSLYQINIYSIIYNNLISHTKYYTIIYIIFVEKIGIFEKISKNGAKMRMLGMAGLSMAGLGMAGLGMNGLGMAGLGMDGPGMAGLGIAGPGMAGLGMGWASYGWARHGWVRDGRFFFISNQYIYKLYSIVYYIII